MKLIEILKGARKRIESAEYLADGNYHEDNIDYGKCYCAVGHIFKEMNVKDKDMVVLEGSYISILDHELLEEQGEPIYKQLKELDSITSELFSLQEANDSSRNDDRKENVLAKLDEIITKLESEQ